MGLRVRIGDSFPRGGDASGLLFKKTAGSASLDALTHAENFKTEDATADLRELVQDLRDDPKSLSADDIRESVADLKARGADFSAGLFGGDEGQDLGLLTGAAIMEDPDLFNAMLEAIPEADRADALNQTWGEERITAMHALSVRGDTARLKAAKAAGGRDDIENLKGYTPAEIAAEHRKRGLPLLAAVSLGGVLTLVGWGVVAGIGIGMLASWYFSSSEDTEQPASVEGETPDGEKTDDSGIADDLFNSNENEVIKDIESGADADGEYPGDISYLLFAAATGQTDAAKAIAEELASEGALKAALNHVGPNGLTPLLAAAFDGNTTLVDYFLDKGADGSLKDSLHGYTAEEALAVAEGDSLEKRGTMDAFPYWPTRRGGANRSRSLRRWIQNIVARFLDNSRDILPVTRLEGQRPQGGGRDFIVPDPELATGDAWRTGSRHNQENLNRVLARAQELVDNINRELGTNYRITHNFNMARNRVGNTPLYLTLGSMVFGSIPQRGFINQDALQGSTLANIDLDAVHGSQWYSGRAPRNMRDQSYYILTGLASLANSARVNNAMRERFRRILGGERTQFIVENVTVNQVYRDGDERGFAHQYRWRGDRNWAVMEFNPFDDSSALSGRIPYFQGFAHEFGHADQALELDGTRRNSLYDLHPGDFDGQRRQIDGVPVVYRESSGGLYGRWMIELQGGDVEVPYIEARQRGVGPFADPTRFGDTDNALLAEYGFPEIPTYYASYDEVSEVDGYHIWGSTEDPWNQPGWKPPPSQPSQPDWREGQERDTPKPQLNRRDLDEQDVSAYGGDEGQEGSAGDIRGHINDGFEQIRSKEEYLQYLETGSNIRTLFSDENTFGGKFIRITQVDKSNNFAIVNQFVIDKEASPEAAKLAQKDRAFQAKLGKDLDASEVIEMRYGDGEKLSPIMKQAADDWLKSHGSVEVLEGKASYESVMEDDDPDTVTLIDPEDDPDDGVVVINRYDAATDGTGRGDLNRQYVLRVDSAEVKELVGADLAFQKKLGKEYDYHEVFRMRFLETDSLTPGMREAADHFLRTFVVTKEEKEAIQEDIADGGWSAAQLQDVQASKVLFVDAWQRNWGRENGIRSYKEQLAEVVNAALYEGAANVKEEDYENALNALAVWIKNHWEGDMSEGVDHIPAFDDKAKRYLHTIVTYLLQDFAEDKGVNEAYHNGDEHLLDELPSIIGNRVENAFADDGSTKSQRSAARDYVRSILEGEKKNGKVPQNHTIMADIATEEYDNYVDWARMYKSGELDTSNDSRYRGAPS